METLRLQYGPNGSLGKTILALRIRLFYAFGMKNPFHRIMVRRRAELDISQATAAARAGVARSTWNTWENIEELPPRDKWHLIAKVLEVPIDALERAGAIQWFVECGPTPFQLSALNGLGISLEGALAEHAYTDPHLFKLDQDLEVDLDRLSPLQAQRVGNLRNHLRKMLVHQDLACRELQESVASFRALYNAIPSRHSEPIVGKKIRSKYKKKPSSARRRPQESE